MRDGGAQKTKAEKDGTFYKNNFFYFLIFFKYAFSGTKNHVSQDQI